MKKDHHLLLNNLVHHEQEEIEEHSNKTKHKYVKIAIGITLILILGVFTGILYNTKVKHSLKSSNTPVKAEFQSFLLEGTGLIASLARAKDQISFYHSVKNLTMAVQVSDEEVQKRNETIITDFILDVLGQRTLESGNELTKVRLVVLNMTRASEDGSSFIGGFNIFDAKTLKEIEELELENLEDIKVNKTQRSEEDEREESTGRFIDTLPIFEFSFFKNGSIYDYATPLDIHGFIETNMEDIIFQIIPTITEKEYEKKTVQTVLKTDVTPGKQKLYERNGIYTTLYQHECESISTPEVDFKGSRMNSDVKIKINNAIGHVEEILSRGSALFVKDEEEEKLVKQRDIAGNFGLYESLEDLENSDDNIIENPIESVGSDFTLSIQLVNITTNETVSNILTDVIKKTKMDYNCIDDISDNDELHKLESKILISFGASNTPLDRDLSIVPTIRTKTQLRNLRKNSFEKPVEFKYDVFKFNLVGVKISLQAVVNADPVTGKVIITAVIGCGKENYPILSQAYENNFGKGIARSIIVINECVELVHNLSSQIDKNSTNWLDVILQNFNTIIPIFKDIVAIDDTFHSIFTNITNKINKTTSSFFNTVSEKIDSANTFFTKLIKQVENAELTEVTNILSKISEQFLSFIKSVQSAADTFHSTAISLLNNIDTLAKEVSSFTIDGIYDLIEKVNKVKEIYTNLVSKVMEAVPNGLDKFHDTAENKAQAILSSVLKIVNFIETALRDNAILKLAIDKTVRLNLADKLNKFDELSHQVISALIQRSKKMFTDAMEKGDKDSEKYKFIQKMEDKLNNFTAKSNDVVKKMQEKIKAFKEFLDFISNLNSVESIQNEIEENILNAYEDNFVETLKEAKLSGADKDVITALNQTLTSNINKIKSDVDSTEAVLKSKFSELKTKYFTSLVTKIKKFSENVKNYRSNQMFNEMNTTINSLYTSLKSTLDSNYNLGEEYVAEIISYKPKYNRPALPNTFQDKFGKFLDAGGELFDNIQDDIDVTVKNGIMNQIRAIRNSMVFSYSIPEAVKDQPGLSFVKMAVEEMGEVINDAKELFSDNYYDYFTVSYIEMNVIKPLGEQNKKRMDQLVKKREPLDSLNYTEGDGKDFCNLRQKCKRVLGIFKKKCWDEGDCITVPRTTNYVNKLVTRGTFTQFNSQIIEIGNKYKNLFNADLTEIKNILNNINTDVTATVNSIQSNTTIFLGVYNGVISQFNSTMDSKMKETLLKQVYNQYKDTAATKVNAYFNRVTPNFNKFITEFHNKVLKQTIKNFVEKPTDLMDTINSIKQYYINGTNLCNKLDNLILTEIKNGMMVSFSNVRDFVLEMKNRFVKLVPDDLKTLFQQRLNLLNNNMTSALESKIGATKGYITTKDVMISILGVKADDFLGLKSTISPLDNKIVTAINNLVNNVTATINTYVSPNKTFDLSEYQSTKARETVEFVKTAISTIVKLIQGKDFNMTNLVNAYLEKFDSSILNNVHKLVEAIQDSLKKIQSKDLTDILASVKILQQTLKTELNNIFDTQELVELLKPIVDETEKNLTFFKFKNSLQTELVPKLKTLFDNEYNRLIKTSFYLEDEYSTSFDSSIKNSIYQLQTTIINQINKNTLNTSLIQNISNKYKSSFNDIKSKVITELQTLLNSFTFNLLGTQIKLSTYTDEVIEQVFTELEHSIDYSVNEIINSQYLQFKDRFIVEMEDIQDMLTNLYDTSFKTNLLDKLKLRSSSSSQNSLKTLDTTLTNNLKNYINTYTNYLKNNSSETIMNSYWSTKLNAIESSFTLHNIIDNLKSSMHSGMTNLEIQCKDKMEMSKNDFMNNIDELLEEGIKNIIDKFSNNVGKQFVERINQRIIVNGINNMVEFVRTKLVRNYNFLDKLLNTTNLKMGDTMKTVIKTIYTTVVSEVTSKVESEITKYTDKFINNLETKINEKITVMFNKTIKNINIYIGEFDDEILKIIKDRISEDLTQQFSSFIKTTLLNTNLKSISDEAKATAQKKVNELRSMLAAHSNLISQKLSKIISPSFDTKIAPILSKLAEFKKKVDEEAANKNFTVPEAVESLVMDFLKNQIQTTIQGVLDKYDVLQNKVVEAIKAELPNFKSIIEGLKKKLATSKVITSIRNAKKAIEEVLQKVIDWINDKVDKFDELLRKHIFTQWNNEMLISQSLTQFKFSRLTHSYRFNSKKKTKVTFDNQLALRNAVDNFHTQTQPLNAVIDIEVIKNSISKFKNFIDNFVKSVKRLATTKNLKSLIETFKESMKLAIQHMKQPFDDLMEKVKTFFQNLTWQKVFNFIWAELKEAIEYTETHKEDVSSNGTAVYNKTNIDIFTIFEGLKGSSKDKIFQILKNLLNLILNQVKPINESKGVKAMPEKVLFSYVIPIFGIPFKFQLGFVWGYEYGLNIGIQDLCLYVEAYARANATLRASAGITFKILEFGASMDGLLGDGKVGIKPKFQIFKFKLALDAYYKLEAFKLTISVYLKFPWVTLTKKPVKFCGIHLFNMWIPNFTKKEIRYGKSTKAGLQKEKHFIKEF